MSTTDYKTNILLALCGGVACYKAAELARLLIKRNFKVKVVMTEGATSFITPLTLQSLTNELVSVSLLNSHGEIAMGHIELARWADLVLVAPATAHFIAKLSHGLADDLLTTLCLATEAPLMIAPAMNAKMWSNPATQANISVLKERSCFVVGPDSGDQACGELGFGRLLEPEILLEHCQQFLRPSSIEPASLSEKELWVITAGSTREPIDSVRYISNYSSGKMGFALAEAAVRAGFDVVLISGPVELKTPEGVRCIKVITAQEMFEQAVFFVQKNQCQVFIGAAAVADFKPENALVGKVKKSEKTKLFSLNLIQNPDILAGVAALQTSTYVIGFAAETDNVLHYARRKLTQKKVDMMIANDVSRSDIGFNSDYNEVTLLTPQEEIPLPMQEKRDLAVTLVKYITKFKKQKASGL